MYLYFILCTPNSNYQEVQKPPVKNFSGHTVIILGRAIGANLLPLAQENMIYGPKWPIKVLDGTKFYTEYVEVKKKCNLSVFDTSMQRETFLGKDLYLLCFI